MNPRDPNGLNPSITCIAAIEHSAAGDVAPAAGLTADPCTVLQT